MNILIIHSVYRDLHLSGENNVVQSQIDFLRTLNNVEVTVVNQQRPSSKINLFYLLRTAFYVASGHGQNPIKSKNFFNPDLILVHNLFPNFSTRWLSKIDVPTIVFSHNYRNFCASGNFFRANKVCDLCMSKSVFYALRHSCYKDSLLATFPLFFKQFREKSKGPKLSKFVKTVCVSEQLAVTHQRSGISSQSLGVIQNFVPDTETFEIKPHDPSEQISWVTIGRLVPEKGMGKLIENWPRNYKLDIIGDGPERKKYEALTANRENIRLLGSLSKSQISEILPRYFGGILPSIWAEGSPLTEIEFLRAGLPIINVARPGYRNTRFDSNLLIPYESFMNIRAEDCILNAVNFVIENQARLRKESRSRYENEFSPQAWIHNLNCHLEHWFGFTLK